MTNGQAKCWGCNSWGELGLGSTSLPVGDEPNEMGDSLPAIDLGSGRSAVSVAAGNLFTCALLNDASIRCWGNNDYGQLGLGDTARRLTMGDALAAADLGSGFSAQALGVTTDYPFVCALLNGGGVKCWGTNGSGRLGLGDTQRRGDDPNEMGDSLPAVDLGPGRSAVSLSVGGSHVCAMLDSQDIKCWGANGGGQLGLGDALSRGDGPNEMGANLPVVDIGTTRTPVSVATGWSHTCATLDDGRVKCWGYNVFAGGELGLGDTINRGDGINEMGDDLPFVDLGLNRTVVMLDSGGISGIGGGGHTCAVLDNGKLKCWGANAHGELGLGDTENRGDDASEMGDNLLDVDL